MCGCSFLTISMESNLHSLPGETAMNHVNKQGTWPFLQGAFLGFQNQSLFLKSPVSQIVEMLCYTCSQICL